MASDGMCLGTAEFQGFLARRSPPKRRRGRRLFDALGDGGTVHQPLIKTFFASRFGMVADRFGVQWMVLTEPVSRANTNIIQTSICERTRMRFMMLIKANKDFEAGIPPTQGARRRDGHARRGNDRARHSAQRRKA